ncbi:MAG: Rubrerythrin [Candidatus Saccharicenans subterraneus]|uniref:Rubrerythrin n=1 Tax=Candidatus Saccharicenans subterraneus TaxID=2508984 RepID=A0A3E2BL99_9BACT|nr:MAG: Rubrerythrin [Candidatus Saccharicenans subterraneum]
MKKITESTVKEALAGESQAHLRYKYYAEKARQENLPNIARLFEAASFSERIHALNHLNVLEGEGKTADNLAKAYDGENFEIEEMYPAYIAVAREQEEKKAATYHQFALAAEKVHAALYARARQAVSQGRDLELPAIHICSVCGFTMEGEAPDRCPVCGAPRNKFVDF